MESQDCGWGPIEELRAAPSTELGADALPPLQTGGHTLNRVILLEQHI